MSYSRVELAADVVARSKATWQSSVASETKQSHAHSEVS